MHRVFRGALLALGLALLVPAEALANGGDSMVLNCGYSRGFSVREVIDAARRVTGHAIPVEQHPRRAGDPAVLVASSEKAQRELGWQPEHPLLDDILFSAWKWHQQLH